MNLLPQQHRLLPELINIHAAVAAVLQERVHVELAIADQISLADLDHGAEFRHTGPGGVQQLAGQRVEHDVDALAIRLAHNAFDEGVVARVEDPVPRDVVVVHQELHLLLVADRHVKVRAEHLTYLDRGDADAAACAVY